MALFAEYFLRGLITGAMYGFLALPISLLLVTVGTLDFALGAYALIAGAVAVSVGGAAGVLLGLGYAVASASVMAAIFYAFRRSKVEDHMMIALASFGLSVALTSMVLIFWGPTAFVANGFDVIWHIGGIGVSPNGILNVGVALVALAVLLAVIYGTGLGRMMRAAATNPVGAELGGVPVLAIQCAMFLVGGMISGLAGILLVYSSGIDFTASLGLSLSAFAAAIVLGADNPAAGFVGGLLIGVAEALSAGYASGGLTSMIPYIVVLLALGRRAMANQRFAGDRP